MKKVFRAYDKETQRYIYSNEVADDTVYRFSFNKSGQIVLLKAYKVISSSIDQYINFKDINGKLIFEKDNVEAHDFYSSDIIYGKIVFKSGSFCIKDTEGILHFNLESYSLKIIEGDVY